ncbi:hypothetical protein Pcinc_002140 [Petrolisthes cinctipes]|uniref:Uncharacterized protein n=1 Tax=Petrolisthes cinctipes TaxID=88211 RepID=A0AAE1GLM7_PETCI|nr:hypothetical protein Pcinc_002140 [Petrolisthes cinctipes]
MVPLLANLSHWSGPTAGVPGQGSVGCVLTSYEVMITGSRHLTQTRSAGCCWCLSCVELKQRGCTWHSCALERERKCAIRRPRPLGAQSGGSE